MSKRKISDLLAEELEKLHGTQQNVSLTPDISRDREKIPFGNGVLTETEEEILKLHLGKTSFKHMKPKEIAKTLHISEEVAHYSLNKAIHISLYSGDCFPQNRSCHRKKISGLKLNEKAFSQHSEKLSNLHYNILLLYFIFKVDLDEIEYYYCIPDCAKIIIFIAKTHPELFK